jgi:class 3 adenylate cyclase
VRRQLERFREREIDTAGNGFLASFDGPARAIRCGGAAIAAVRELGLEIRAGVHTGVAAQASPGEVLVSSTVRDLVAGSGLEFEDRGSAPLKGVPCEWRLYALSPVGS